MRLAIWTSVLAAAAIVAGVGFGDAVRAAAPPISKLEARRLPAAVVAARVAAELADRLSEPPRPKGGRPPTRPLQDLWYWTRTRAADAPGLCVADLVIFSFKPVSAGRRVDASTPTTVSGVSADGRYSFLRPPASPDPDAESAPERHRTERACTALDPERASAHFFAASSAQQATRGAWILGELHRALGDGSFAGPVGCSGLGAGETCRDIVGAIGFDKVSSISDCGRDDTAPTPYDCWLFDAGDKQLQVYVDVGFLPRHVLETNFIVFGDTRID
jgi:hypothetical protein